MYLETWPSGKAGACKALIPGSNPGVSFFDVKVAYERNFGFIYFKKARFNDL